MKHQIAKYAGYVMLIAICFLLVITLFGSSSSAQVDADSELEQAKLLLVKAMKTHCKTIGQRTLDCYSGNADECTNVMKSIEWFTNQYGDSPEVACVTQTPYFLGELSESDSPDIW